MKKLLLMLLGLALAITIVFAYQYRSRAAETDILLAKISYTNDAEFEKAFDSSISVHYFYEKPAGEESYMISRLTEQQFEQLVLSGYLVELLDTNPDMSTYMVVYTPQEVAPGSFATLGETDALDDHFTLVKGNVEDHDGLIDPDIAVFVYSLENPLKKPAYKTVRVESE